MEGGRSQSLLMVNKPVQVLYKVVLVAASSILVVALRSFVLVWPKTLKKRATTEFSTTV